MEQTLQAMGNTVGSAFAYFAFVLQIISKFFSFKILNIIKVNMMSAFYAFVERKFRYLSQLTILRYPVSNLSLTELELERYCFLSVALQMQK